MARIVQFEEGARERLGLHDPVDATIFKYELDGRKLLQIDTFGRGSREIPGKVSQSIQLDQESAGQLFNILKEHFGLT